MSIYYDVYPGSIYPNNIYDTYIYDPLIAYYEDELRKLMKKNYEELKAEFDRKMKKISKKIEKIGEKSFMMGVALGFSDITNEGDEIHDTIVKVKAPDGVEAADYVNEEEEDQIDDLDEYLDTPPDSPKMPQKTIQPKKPDEFKLEKPIEPKLRDFTLKKQGRPSNIARSKYLHAKKDYEERMKNYAKEYAKYERQMKEYEESMKKYKEYEQQMKKYEEDLKKYKEGMAKYEEEKKKTILELFTPNDKPVTYQLFDTEFGSSGKHKIVDIINIAKKIGGILNTDSPLGKKMERWFFTNFKKIMSKKPPQMKPSEYVNTKEFVKKIKNLTYKFKKQLSELKNDVFSKSENLKTAKTRNIELFSLYNFLHGFGLGQRLKRYEGLYDYVLTFDPKKIKKDIVHKPGTLKQYEKFEKYDLDSIDQILRDEDYGEENRPLYDLRDYDHFWNFKKHYEIERKRENLRKELFEKKSQELFHKYGIKDKREQEMILNKYKNTTLRTLNRRLFDELSNIERIVNWEVTVQIDKLKREAFGRGELFKKYKSEKKDIDVKEVKDILKDIGTVDEKARSDVLDLVKKPIFRKPKRGEFNFYEFYEPKIPQMPKFKEPKFKR